jgi:hypothetical protein
LQAVAGCHREVVMGKFRLWWAIVGVCMGTACEETAPTGGDAQSAVDVGGEVGPDAPGDTGSSDALAADATATEGLAPADTAAAGATVYLNEIAAQGTPLGNFNPSGGDWVEVYNSGASPIDLAGWRIASPAKGFANAHPIPPGASVPAKGFLILYFNHDNAGSPVIDDKLKGSVDAALQLWDDGGVAVDQASWLATQVIKGGSVGRQPDGSPTWKVYAKSQASPGQANK